MKAKIASKKALRSKVDVSTTRKKKTGDIGKLAIRELSHFNLIDLFPLLTTLASRIWSPWAILLVRFRNDTQPSPPLTKYLHLFTSAGSGTLNMVDFFSDMSHGQIDISGTQVFGWFTLPANRSDYVGNVYPQPAGKLNRNGLLDLAKATATSTGINLNDFAGVVVCGLDSVDLCGWVGGMAALCDSFSLSPSLVGQEMGHGYGLDHARFQGSVDDYRDPWDVMSTAAYPWIQAAHTEFTTVGPGLNAWNMRSRNWLDENRVWKAPAPASAWDETIQLRPLHHHNLPGFLAAQIGPYLVEFRVPERWDAALPRACVLVHRFAANHSYLLPAYSGSQDIVAGDKFMIGDPTFPFQDYYAAEVTAIDSGNHTATIRLHQRPATPFPRPHMEFAGQLFGGVTVDGGGFFVIGGRIIPIPPRGPEKELVEQVARYLETELSATGVGRTLLARQEVLVAIVRSAVHLYAETEIISEQPPGYMKEKEEQ